MRLVRHFSRALALTAVGVALSTSIIAAPWQAEAATAETFYVDAVSGVDAADGLTPATAWKSLDRANEQEFDAGDRILLRRGSLWEGQTLTPTGSGAEGAPIIVDAFGEGARPRIAVNGEHEDGVRLWNQDHWEIRNLDVSNAAFATDPTSYNAAGRAGDFRGILIGGDDGQQHHHFVIDGVSVHDVTGEVRWIGERSGYTPPNGISFGNGWDRSKNTGGIVVLGSVADVEAPGSSATTFHGVSIQNSEIQNTSFGAITIKQYTGDAPGAVSTGWGERASADDPSFSPHSDISIRNNYITQAGTAYGANGIYVTGARDVIVEENLVDRVGTSGIETYNADRVTIQRNEVNYTTVKAGGQDSNAIDTDIASTNQIVQYNYVYGNGEGILVYQKRFGDATFRYNVIAASTKSQIHIASDAPARGQIYNNTILDTAGTVIAAGSQSGKYTLRNNILFSSTGHAVSTGNNNLTYARNLYSGVSPTTQESDAYVVDPGLTAIALAAPITGTPRPADLTQVESLVPTSSSRAVGSAAVITDNGGSDIRGVAIYQGDPDFGALEYITPVGQLSETVVGRITSTPSGSPVPGATVTVTGAPTPATTAADGWYAVTGVPFATDRVVSVARPGFATAERPDVTVSAGSPTRLDIALTATASAGAVTGTVVDALQDPVTDALVTVIDSDGQERNSTRTAEDGTFSVAVEAGSGYSVVVSAAGLLDGIHPGVAVEAALDTSVGTIILSGRDVSYAAIIDFEDFAPGPASSAPPVTFSAQNGTATIETEEDGQFARLIRTSGTGSSAPATSLAWSTATPLTGVVTVEQRVRRPADQPSAQFFGGPYIRNSAGQNLISIGFSAGKISAYNGGTYLAQVATYRADEWVRVRAVIDTNAQTYSLYIDGTPALQNARLRNPVGSGIAAVVDYADGVNRGTLDVDDIRIAQGIGYSASETALGTLAFDSGALSQVSPTSYVLAFDEATTSVHVDATALSPFARAVLVNGRQIPQGGLDIKITDDPVVISVVAEDGTVLDYRVETRLPAEPTAPEWSSTAVYTAGDRVSAGGSDYVAQWWSQNQRPGTSNHGPWAEVGAPVTCSSGRVASWTPSGIYTGSETVAFDGRLWSAQWWTRAQTPGDQWGPWRDLGAC